MNTPNKVLESLRRVDPEAEPVDSEDRFGRVEYIPLGNEGERVVVAHNGVPYLRVWRRADGTAMLVLDQRFGLELPADSVLIENVVHFVSESIAVGGGYASIERVDIRMPFR